MNLKKKVEELESEVKELRRQLLELALQSRTTFVPVPAPAPLPPPNWPPMVPYFPEPNLPSPYWTITCNLQGGGSLSGLQGGSTQYRQNC
jgi:hypothetical protein